MSDLLLLQPQAPLVDEVKRVVLYDYKNKPLVRAMGFKRDE